MAYSGAFFYDNETAFKNYMDRRTAATSANETIEKPILKELIGQLDGIEVLDLGCGEATIAKELFEAGISSYTGVEGSRNMVKLAQKSLNHQQAEIIHDFIECYEYPEQQFDLVISRLAFHYIEDLTPVFKKIHGTLKESGRFVFSVEHPVITSHHTSYEKGGRQDWTVDHYFKTGQRVTKWLGEQVIKYHRTVEEHFMTLQNTGFQILNLRESCPRREHITDKKLFERRMRIPLFLFLSAQKITLL